jgi:hypothetical protein
MFLLFQRQYLIDLCLYIVTNKIPKAPRKETMDRSGLIYKDFSLLK